MNQTQPDKAPATISIGRRPVFDIRNRLWGYELFCVGSDDAALGHYPQEDSEAAASIASSAYIGLQQILKRDKKIILDFNEKHILNDLPYAFPPVLAVVKVDEDDLGLPSFPEILLKLKKDGYQIAVQNYTARSDLKQQYPLADIFRLTVQGKNKESLAREIEGLGSMEALLMAVQVENNEQVEICRKLGFSLFEGPFFKTAEIVTMRKLSSTETARLNLLKVIHEDEPDIDRLAEAIQSDASVSFRLLAYLNSAAFGFPQKVKSIQHALSLLGWRKIKNWLRVILLADVDQGEDSAERFNLAAQRGKFLELVAEAHDFWDFDPESLHLLGLFSLLDVMLGIPMEEVVTFLPLDNKIKSALCRDPNNEYLPLLHLARCLEDGVWTEAETLIRQLNLDPAKTKSAFQEAINWATELTTFKEGAGAAASM